MRCAANGSGSSCHSRAFRFSSSLGAAGSKAEAAERKRRWDIDAMYADLPHLKEMSSGAGEARLPKLCLYSTSAAGCSSVREWQMSIRAWSPTDLLLAGSGADRAVLLGWSSREWTKERRSDGDCRETAPF